MKSNVKYLLFLSSCFLILSSCLGTGVFSYENITLNNNVQDDFIAGETPDRNLFQYGQNPDKALDIVVPLDPNGSQNIAKSHNYYVSLGSQVEFNMETLINFKQYEVDDDLEKKGKLKIPLQWLSCCTFLDPKTGNEIKGTDGNDKKININADNVRDFYKAYLKRCKSTPVFRAYNTKEGPLYTNCDKFEMGGENDLFINSNSKTNGAYPLCMLGGKLVIDAPSTFTREVVVTSYNDDNINFEELTFSHQIEPTFFVVDSNIKLYRVNMVPDPDNGEDNFLRYSWQMPIIDGLWQDNFASDINIEFVRFYWTNILGHKIPITPQPILGSPPHKIQIGNFSTCSSVDDEGYFKPGSCNIISNYTPASPKDDLTIRVIWNMSILFDEYYVELDQNWMNNVVLEFGIRTN